MIVQIHHKKKSKNANISGFGKYKWATNEEYEGEFEKNEITGFGTYNFGNGVTYEGHVWHGMRHGYGVLTINDTSQKDYYRSYKGYWDNGLRHGVMLVCFLP